MSIQALQDYTSYAKYAKYDYEKKRRENWGQQVGRMFGMHERRFADILVSNGEFAEAFDFAKQMILKKQVLGSQRALQYGGKGIEKHNAKIYNCVDSYCDRPRFFQEYMYLLLCGCGAGFSVQKRHFNNLPEVKRPDKGKKLFTPDDSIEGWADCLGVLMSSYFKGKVPFPEYQGYSVEYDFSLIREEGMPIAGDFKAPGHEPLQYALEKVEEILIKATTNGSITTTRERKLRTIEGYDILMHASDAVLSGGVRRSASLCMFDADDQDMIMAKTGNWLEENPQRARSNNSAVLIKGQTSKEVYEYLFESVRQYGEPAFVWVDDPDIVFNPCVEISMYPQINKISGWQGCNLGEINGKKSVDEEAFLMQCKAVAIITTMQADYTYFPYLTKESQQIFEREALIGCSITGMMENPDVLFDPEIQRKGAEIIKEWNEKVAEWIGINVAARTTCIKPAGTSSLLLGTSSGVHPHHAKKYIRRVQANKLEFPAQYFAEVNPLAVEKSVWGGKNKNDLIVSFLCEVPQGSITKNQLSAIELLEKVKLTQKNWVEAGTRIDKCIIPNIRHNVSNTITVKDDEWHDVFEFIWENQQYFSGVSLLSYKGDKDYPQAPNTTILTPSELIKEYGDAAVFASGLIVDGLHAYSDLWTACDYVLGIKTIPENLGFNQHLQKDWIRRAKQFADRYFEGNDRRMTYCLKDVNNWKLWVDLKRTYKDIDWDEVVEPEPFFVDINTTGAVACHGGACEV